MALDGSGTYSPPAPQFPAIPDTLILSADFNEIILDIATALSLAIFRDGQAAFTANQSMGGNKLTNLANGANPQDAVNVLQVFTNPAFTANSVAGITFSGTKVTFTLDTLLFSANAVQLTADTVIVTTPSLDCSNCTEVILPSGATGVTQSSDDSTTKIATTAFVQAVAFNTALPAQAGNTGKFVTTDGLNASWAEIPPPPGFLLMAQGVI